MTDLPHGLGQLYALVVGLVVGSFLAVCIVRLPEDHSLLVASHCPHCGRRVRWRDLVPVLSWLALRGKCRDCARPISPLYPLVELLTGLLSLLLFRSIFPGPEAYDLAHLAGWLHYFVFLCLCLVLAYVDLRYRFIPDGTSIYAVPVGVLTASLAQWLGFEGWDGFGAVGFRSAIFGAALWGTLFLVFKGVTRFVGRDDALGMGDVKLAAMFGAFLGVFPGTHLALLFGSVFGSIAGITSTLVYWRRTWLAFGPSLALGAVVYVLCGPALFGWLYR